MGAAPYFDEEELAALGRPKGAVSRPASRAGIRLTHDPVCSKSGAVAVYRCPECEVILRTRADAMRKERMQARLRRSRPPSPGVDGQLPLWRDF
jgi:uncharacterized C2H2 Zn-finger protein